MRFFRSFDDAVYEQVRTTLNAAWGLPNGKGTDTCLPTLQAASRDPSGNIVLPIDELFCEWQPADAMIPQLLGSGVVAEITMAEYHAAVAKPTP